VITGYKINEQEFVIIDVPIEAKVFETNSNNLIWNTDYDAGSLELPAGEYEILFIAEDATIDHLEHSKVPFNIFSNMVKFIKSKKISCIKKHLILKKLD